MKERIAITLRLLATEDTFHSLIYLFKVIKRVISNIVPKVCDALVERLQECIKVNYIKILSNHINVDSTNAMGSVGSNTSARPSVEHDGKKKTKGPEWV